MEKIAATFKTVSMLSAKECDAALCGLFGCDLARVSSTDSKEVAQEAVGCGELGCCSSTPCPRHIGQEFRPVVSHCELR
jgi:hypothetical protein